MLLILQTILRIKMKLISHLKFITIPIVLGISTVFSTAHAGSLVAHYKFDSATGNAVTDSSGNGHKGTLGGPSSTTGKSGQALQFDCSSMALMTTLMLVISTFGRAT